MILSWKFIPTRRITVRDFPFRVLTDGAPVVAAFSFSLPAHKVTSLKLWPAFVFVLFFFVHASASQWACKSVKPRTTTTSTRIGCQQYTLRHILLPAITSLLTHHTHLQVPLGPAAVLSFMHHRPYHPPLLNRPPRNVKESRRILMLPSQRSEARSSRRNVHRISWNVSIA